MLTLAVLLVLAMGYMAMKTYRRPQPKIESYEEQLEKMKTQSQSDSVDSIEKDLNETDLENVDAELQDIDTELNSASNE